MRRAILTALLAASVLSGCGSNSLDSIKVSGGDEPKITGVKNYSVGKTETRLITAGKGAEVTADDTIIVDYLAVNGRTGSTFDSTFAAGKPAPLPLQQVAVKGFRKALTGQRVGSRILTAIAPSDGFGQAVDQYGLKKDDTMVVLFDIKSVQPSEATGAKKPAPASVPQLELDKDGHPSGFGKSAGVPAKAPLKATVVIQGTGAAVTKGQTIAVQYMGVLYPDGAVFDTSWDKSVATFPIGTGNVIKCWDKLLPGVKIGSRVILTCPSATAYGKSGQGELIGPNADLVFAVDVLAAM